MITGWFISLVGILGQDKAQITNPMMNYIGVALCASCVVISSFIKNEEEEKEALQRKAAMDAKKKRSYALKGAMEKRRQH